MASDRDGTRGVLVCVTGRSRFVGLWLIRLVLDRRYTVHATVKNLQDEGETKHQQALDGADTRLRLFQMDLLDPATIRPAVEGARGISCDIPSNELLEPALKGTIDVLRTTKECGVNRVVMLSSQTAMVPNPNWPAGKVISDDSWADVELQRNLDLWYNLSKTVAEKAAWDFTEKEGLELVVLNPALVLGPTLTPAITASLHVLLQILKGQRYDMDEFFVGSIDVRDVAQSLIVLYENPSAQGRHLCLESSQWMVDFTNKLADLYPQLPVQRIHKDKQDWVVRAKDPSKKLIDLGVRFNPFEKTISDTMDCLTSKGLI